MTAGVHGLTHVGLLTNDIERTARHLVHDLETVCGVFTDVLGFTADEANPVDLPDLGIRTRRLAWPPGPAIEIVRPVAVVAATTTTSTSCATPSSR